MPPNEVKAIPEGMHTVTPHIVVRDAGRAATDLSDNDFFNNLVISRKLGTSKRAGAVGARPLRGLPYIRSILRRSPLAAASVWFLVAC
jgi:hypothetical protein